MAKKKSTEVVEANARTSAPLTLTEVDSAAALSLGVMLGGSTADRVSRAITAYNQAARMSVEAGYLLLSVKSELAHGEFETGIESLGLKARRAQELMLMAKFATSLPDDRRAELLSLPKSQVLVLAGADASVIEDLLQDEDGNDVDLSALTVRELRDRVKELADANTDLGAQVDKAEADKKALEKKLKRRALDEEDGGVPMAVADVRAEGVALLKKAELAITSLHPIGVQAYDLVAQDGLTEWSAPTLRLFMSGAVALRMQLDGLIGNYATALAEDAKKLASAPAALAFLDPSEIKSVAEEWARLTATHQHEAALREHERESAKPRGKGRPTKAPEAPTA